MQQLSSKQFVSLFGTTLLLFFSVLITLCLIIPKGNEILWINGNYSPFQDWLFSSVTLIGNAMVFVILITALSLIRFNYSIIFSAVFVLNSIIVLFLKRIVFPDMLRPTAWLDNSLLHFVEGVDVEVFYSFPSGHTATIFAIAVTLSLYVRRKGWTVLFLSLALIVGYSRIYLLQHHLIDVMAGAFIGTISSFIVYSINPISKLQRLYAALQKQFENKELLPPFIVNSHRVRKWVERVGNEV